jgi:HAD superfamily hydrolase (TIGR01549 family)
VSKVVHLTFAMLFDLDGTLVDSKKQIQVSLDKARVTVGHPATPVDLVQEQLGLPVESLFSDLRLGPLELDELVQIFRKNLLLEIKKGNRIFDGVLPFILKSKNLGISIGVATTKPTYLAKEVIDNSELAKLIDFIQGTDGFSPKPDPEVLRRCMQGLGIENAVMFGDRIEDIQAAETLGIPSIGIAQSAHSIQDLLGEGATYSFSNFTELGLNFDLIIQLIKKV